MQRSVPHSLFRRKFLCYTSPVNRYELTIVLDGKTGASKKKKLEEALGAILKLFGGEIKDSKDLGVKDLAYQIGKSETGLYLFWEIEIEPKGVKALNDKLRTNADIMRYLIVKKE